MKPLKILLSLVCIYGLNAAAANEIKEDLSFENFYRAVHTQSMDRNFIRFRHRPLVTIQAWRSFNEATRVALLKQAPLVLVFSKIQDFIRLNEIVSNVGIKTEMGANLQFDIKYYETLRDIGINGDFKAMCALPYFDKCILLGYEAF